MKGQRVIMMKFMIQFQSIKRVRNKKYNPYRWSRLLNKQVMKLHINLKLNLPLNQKKKVMTLENLRVSFPIRREQLLVLIFMLKFNNKIQYQSTKMEVSKTSNQC